MLSVAKTVGYRVNHITNESDRQFRGAFGALWRIRLVDPRGGVIRIFCLPRPGLKVGSTMNLEPPRPLSPTSW